MTLHRSRTGLHDPVVDGLRAQVVTATHRMLDEPATHAALTLELVAARAGVARALVHTQFGSPAGVLAAVLADLTTRSALELQRAFALPDLSAVVTEYVAIAGRFWDGERVVMRRLKGLAAFDADLAHAFARADEHRREGLRRVMQRLPRPRTRVAQRARIDPADALLALTAFETFDVAAGFERTIADAVPTVQALVRAALGLGDD